MVHFEVKKGGMVMTKLLGILKEEEGQGMTEYGLILGLIVVIAVAVFAVFGPQITAIFTRTGTKLNAVT